MMDSMPEISPKVTRRPFTLIWLSNTGSNLSDGMGLTAAPLLAATLTRDPLLIAGLVFAQRLPWVLFTLISGALVDRLDRRKILIYANVARTMLMLLLGWSVLGQWISLPVLYGIFFAIGIIETFFDNASLAILPSIVPKEHLERANGRLFATQTLANEMIGPPVASFLYAAAQAVPFFLSGVMYGCSSVLVSIIQGHFKPNTPARIQKVHHAIIESMQWFWRHRLLRTLALVAGMVNFVSAAVMGIFVLYVQNILGLSDAYYGVLIASGAVGGIIGSLIADIGVKRLGPGHMLFLDILGNGIGYLVIALTTSPILVGIMFVIISMSNMVGNVILISLRQSLVPDNMLGRVASAYRLIVLGALPMGALFGGSVARITEVTTPIWIGGLLLILVAFVMLPIVNNQNIKQAQQANESPLR